MFTFLEQVPPINTEVLVHLKDIESSVFNELRLFVLVNIGGIVDHHYLKFLFIH